MARNRNLTSAEGALEANRRQLMGLTGLTALAGVWASRSWLPWPAPLSGGTGSTGPRFVSAAAKAERLRNYRVFVPTGLPDAMLTGRPSGSTVAVHASDSIGRVRLFAAVDAQPDLRAVSVADIAVDRSGAAIGRAHVPSGGRTSEFEVAALSSIAAGDFRAAGATLHAGARVTTLAAARRRPNFRLLDLLAGLSVRHAEAVPYLSAAIAMIEEIGGLTKEDTVRAAVASRLARWSDETSPWHRRWADRGQAVAWRHPWHQLAATGPAEGKQPRVLIG